MLELIQDVVDWVWTCKTGCKVFLRTTSDGTRKLKVKSIHFSTTECDSGLEHTIAGHMPNRLKSALAAHQAHSARLTAEAKAKKRDREIAQAKQSSGAKSKKQKKDKDKRHRVEGVITPGASTSHLTGSSTTGIDDGVKTRGPTLVNNDPPRQRPTIPFDKSDTILLLGEANFSYAHSLILPPHSHPPHLLLATSYDSEKMCYEKYPDAEGLVRILRETGVRVGWVVDSGDLERCKMVAKGRRWSRVIFNFPHVGEYFSTYRQRYQKPRERLNPTNRQILRVHPTPHHIRYYGSRCCRLLDPFAWKKTISHV